MNQQGLEELRDYLRSLMTEYAEQPRRFDQLLGEIGKQRWREPLAPGEWTPHQVVAHVDAAETQAFQERLRRIVEEERPNLPGWDGDHWMETEYQPDSDLENLQARWSKGRDQALEPLRELPLTEWNRVGIHESWGEKTLLWWLEYSVSHAQEHLEQLKAATITSE